jgi:hypothetical protein
MDDPVYVLYDDNGTLVAGGLFRYAGGILSNGVARWDGQRWWPLGSACSATIVPSRDARVGCRR